jgi:hypothetical protein
MTENITNPTRTVDDILEALFPRCTEPLEGFKNLSPSLCDCGKNEPHTESCKTLWCWHVTHVPFTASEERLRRERIDWALRIANDPDAALALDLTLETGRRLSLTHMVLGGFVKTCKVAGRDPLSEESLLWFLEMFTHTPGDFLIPPFV